MCTNRTRKNGRNMHILSLRVAYFSGEIIINKSKNYSFAFKYNSSITQNCVFMKKVFNHCGTLSRKMALGVSLALVATGPLQAAQGGGVTRLLPSGRLRSPLSRELSLER